MKTVLAIFLIFLAAAKVNAGNFSNSYPQSKTTNELGCKQVRPAKLFGECFEDYDVSNFPDALQCSSAEPTWSDDFFLKQGSTITHKTRATEPSKVTEARILVKLETKSPTKIVLAHHSVFDGGKSQTNFEFKKNGQFFKLRKITPDQEYSLNCKPVDLLGLSVDEYGTCLGVIKYRESDTWFAWKNEETDWSLSCGSNIKMAKRVTSEKQQSTSLASSPTGKVISRKLSSKTSNEQHNRASADNALNSSPNKTCANLNNKILSHIEKEEYSKAKAAKELMNEFNCNGEIIASKTAVQNAKTTNFSPTELSCSIGPIGKTIFGTYGEYFAKSYDNNPSKNCETTYQYCKARARSIADGARIKPSERSNGVTSYSGYCNSNSIGADISTNCNVYSNEDNGGFAGGLADGLAKGIEVAASKKKIYVSNFEICMADMGYSLKSE